MPSERFQLLTETEKKWYDNHFGMEKPEDCTWSLGCFGETDQVKIGYGGIGEDGQPRVVIHQGGKFVLVPTWMAGEYITQASRQAEEIAARSRLCPKCGAEK
jgi:hypothetical protein